MQQEMEQNQNQQQERDPKKESEQTLFSVLGGDVPHVDNLLGKMKENMSTQEVEKDLGQKSKDLIDTKQEIEQLLQNKADAKDLSLEEKIKLQELRGKLDHLSRHPNYDAGDLVGTQRFWEGLPGVAEQKVQQMENMKKGVSGEMVEGDESVQSVVKQCENLTEEDRQKFVDAIDERVAGFKEHEEEIANSAVEKRFSDEEKEGHITRFEEAKTAFQSERRRVSDWLSEIEAKFLPR